jgi:hypothetical protein
MTNGKQPVSDPSNPAASTERHLADIADAPLNLHDYETAARAVLPRMNYDYIARAAGDEVTLRSNRAAFDRWRTLPRVLRGGTATLGTTVLGQSVSMPVVVAPTSLNRLAHPVGELASARVHRYDLHSQHVLHISDRRRNQARRELVVPGVLPS